jgi:hypothetical protein
MWQNAVEVGLWRSAVSSSPAKPGIGSLVEVLYDDGSWYSGMVQSQDKSGKFVIKFDDGETANVDNLEDDPDIRIISAPSQANQAGHKRSADPESGPWATWLDTYLPDLLHSSFRSARQGKVDKNHLDRIMDSKSPPLSKRTKGKKAE